MMRGKGIKFNFDLLEKESIKVLNVKEYTIIFTMNFLFCFVIRISKSQFRFPIHALFQRVAVMHLVC